MKYFITSFIILCLGILMLSCHSNKATTRTEAKQDRSGSDFISGKVNEIKPGKDGYTAQIITAGNLAYFATVSRSNLKNAEQYKTVNIGDTITVKGDIWKMETESHITVREMK